MQERFKDKVAFLILVWTANAYGQVVPPKPPGRPPPGPPVPGPPSVPVSPDGGDFSWEGLLIALAILGLAFLSSLLLYYLFKSAGRIVDWFRDIRHRATLRRTEQEATTRTLMLTRVKEVLAAHFPNFQKQAIERLLHDLLRDGVLRLPSYLTPDRFRRDLVTMDLTFTNPQERDVVEIVLLYDGTPVLRGRFFPGRYAPPLSP